MSTKVLVVDDEVDLVEILKEEIETLGDYEVQSASNGKQALDKLKDFPAKIVLSDINMPQMDGIELLEQIKAFPSNKPYLILMTGFAGYEKEELIKNGAYSLLKKPFEFDEIEKLLETLSTQ